MKHSVLNKLLLAFICLLVVAAGLGFICLALKVTDGAYVTFFIDKTHESLAWAILSALIGFLLSAVAIYAAYALIRSSRNAVENEAAVLIKQGEDGSLHISADALKTMVKQYCARLPYVADSECAELPNEKKNTLGLRVAFAQETDIADELAGLQEGLREYLKGACGLQVQNIDITIIPKNE